jgi:hypothetical protein
VRPFSRKGDASNMTRKPAQIKAVPPRTTGGGSSDAFGPASQKHTSVATLITIVSLVLFVLQMASGNRDGTHCSEDVAAANCDNLRAQGQRVSGPGVNMARRRTRKEVSAVEEIVGRFVGERMLCSLTELRKGSSEHRC